MKSYTKYGFVTACSWNILLFFALIIRADVKDVSISYFFDDDMGGMGIAFFLIVWTLIWFGIGSHTRKDFLTQKQSYRNQYPDLDTRIFDKAFTTYYFSKHAKILSIVFTTAIPWYVIGYVREPLNGTDFIIITPLMFLSIFCFWFYKKYYKFT